MTELVVCAATPDDIRFASSCAHAAFLPYVERIGRKPAPMTANFAAHHRAGDLLIAWCDQQPVGYAVLLEKAGQMLLDNIAVSPAHQGRGFGKQLLASCEAMARERGYDSLHLYTNAAMTENLALYRRLGYEETERRSEDGFERHYFVKRLVA